MDILKKISQFIRWGTFIISGLLILTSLVLPVIGYEYMTVKQYIWLFIVTGIGYVFSILMATKSYSLWSYVRRRHELYLFFAVISSPFVAIFLLVSIIMQMLDLNPNIHFSFMFMIALGLLPYSYLNRGDIEEELEEHQQMNDAIQMKKDHYDNMW